MKLNPDLVGTRLRPYKTKVCWRQTTNYAAAVQDNNPKYFNDRAKQGETVFTEYVGAMLRGVDCGQGSVSGTIPAVPEVERKTENDLWTSAIKSKGPAGQRNVGCQ